MKIARTLHVMAICLLIAAAVYVYQIKYQATWRAEEVARLERQIAREKTAIAVLNAEWAFLLRPDRIQILTEKNLDLKPQDSQQRIALADIPMRPERVDSIADTIASLGMEVPLSVEAPPPADDPIARTIEAMGLAMPGAGDRVKLRMRESGFDDLDAEEGGR
ncbi:cell division protein FtsL [Terrihabitans sp. B22-R8]|uniref:cell division protein FtsL n=1 Tax=Terrihabitans sp. B22-R8 TaxID=3425128 RepID=UPI00403C20DC